jgi:tRNA pseudouridine55 synthase
MPPPGGFLNINKPLGITSHDVVAQVRRILHTKKVGHAGTLDPLATGVLIICVGSATRLSEYVMAGTKAYRAVIHLGIETTTYDAEGEIVAANDASAITLEQIAAALPAYVGEIDQLPPLYSAIKQGGRKLYEIARNGETVVVPVRRITIQGLELTAWSPPMLTLDVTCSAGTYIRSLAHDLGAALGVGGSLDALTRTASGAFTLENSTSLDELKVSDNPAAYLVSPVNALSEWKRVVLDGNSLADILHGRTTPRAETDPPDELVVGIDPTGKLVAILRRAGDYWQPEKVFSRDV